VVVPGIHELRNVPITGDAGALLSMITMLGGTSKRHQDRVVIDTRGINSKPLAANVTEQSTGSFLFAGALLARFRHADLGPPGGDRLGPRPVDRHLSAFEDLGVSVSQQDREYALSAPQLHPAAIQFDHDTVNGTVNATLAALGARGTTTIDGASIDPDVLSLMGFLQEAGAQVDADVARSRITVQGPYDGMCDTRFAVPADRNDAATLIIAAALCRSTITLRGITTAELSPLLHVLGTIGLRVSDTAHGSITVRGEEWRNRRPLHVESGPYPGFLTDWGPLIQVLMTQLHGVSTFTERIFTARFRHLDEIHKMGAEVHRDSATALTAYISGPTRLHGATVVGQDVRGTAALLLAAMIADGETVLHGVEHLDRGYDDLTGRLQNLGAAIERAGQS
jgi:UDP-N-acetylglucosamine 1-carboxyvinyltransferase